MDQAAIDQLRAETPGCAHVTHFNNAGAALMPDQVIDAVAEFTRREIEIGSYAAQVEFADRFERVYDAAAGLLNCDRNAISITSGGSEAWWRAFMAVPLEPGDRIVAGRGEFVSSAAGLVKARADGVEVVTVPTLADGTTDLDALQQALAGPTKLVCLTHVPMTQGVINPVAEATAIAHDRGALVLLDATQSVGQIPVDVAAIGCDFMTATGRKWLRGPRGTGLLYVDTKLHDRLRPPVFVDGRSGAWSGDDYQPASGGARFELGERSHSAVLGLLAAIELAAELGVDRIAGRVHELARLLRFRLAETPGVTVHDATAATAGIVGFSVDGWDDSDVASSLMASHITVAAPRAMASFHDLHDRGLRSIVRAAPHYYNTGDEIDVLIEALQRL
ncbi:MAG: aminotransferase class V-fold PLP-dependent enzyme [Acidimicrobiales bacterium]